LLLVAILAIGLISPWLLSTAASFVLYPFHATSLWLKTSEGVLPTYLRSKSELAAEVETLRAAAATGVGTQLSISRLLEENMQLRAMAKAGAVENRLVARVLARPGQLSYDLLQIDKGTNDGVVLGAPVYTGLDSVVGIVVHTAPTYAFVDLFTSPGFESTAFIFGPNVFSPIEGMGGGVARVKLPQGVLIREGQLVILPGISSGIYGEIIAVQNEPTQPEQYGYITPPIAMSSLSYVSVGLQSVELRSPDQIQADIRAELRASLRLSTTTEMLLASTTPLLPEEIVETAPIEVEVVGE
jgi:cell shape-determining protein MreC